MTAAHMQRKRWIRSPRPLRSLQICRAAAGRKSDHGKSISRAIGKKKPNGSSRWCSGVMNRPICSRMKKKRANSGFLSETRTNQGAAMRMKSGRPVPQRIPERRRGLRAMSAWAETAATGRRTPTGPFARAANARDAQERYGSAPGPSSDT